MRALRWTLGNSGTLLAGLSLVLVVAATAALVWPGTVTGEGETCTANAARPGQPSPKPHCVKTRTTVWGPDGQGGLMLTWGVVLAVVASVPLLARGRLARLASGLIMLFFVVIGALSIGLAFAPAALIMLLSVAAPSAKPRTS